MSKTHTELAPHIEEITWALQNEIESHEIESELETFVNTYGISLQDSKRAIIRKFGGNPHSLSLRCRTYRVSELKNNLFHVDIDVRVLSITKGTYLKKGKQLSHFFGILGDGTGKIEFTAWHDFGLCEGKAYRFSHCYTKSWHGMTQIHLGMNTQVETISDELLPDAEILMQDSPVTIDHLTQGEGTPRVEVNGFVLSILGGSGLIYRCPICKRVMHKNTCSIHGDIEGNPDLRIKGTLDDGYGALYFIVNRDVTEGIMGMDLDQFMQIASDRMDIRVVQDLITERLMGEYVSATGRVVTDEYCTTLQVRSFQFGDWDVKKAAITMLKELEGWA